MFLCLRSCAGTWGGRARLLGDRERRRSRLQRNKSSVCRESWGNTAPPENTGPDIPEPDKEKMMMLSAKEIIDMYR